MIPTGRAIEFMKELHEEMNAVGKCNTYVITEDVVSGNIYMNVHTADRELSDEEKKSFSQLFDKIKPYIIKRTKDFKEKSKSIEQASVKNLRIDKLIDRLVVVNIPSESNKNSGQYQEHLIECLTRALVSALSKVQADFCNDKQISEKDNPCNTPQEEPHQ